MHPLILLQGVPLHGGASAWVERYFGWIDDPLSWLELGVLVLGIWLAVDGVRYWLWLRRDSLDRTRQQEQGDG